MEIKHKECFIPNFIKYMGLQPVSKYAREACEFVNLYSKWRGANRFPAYLKVLELLKERPEVQARNAKIPELKGLREWVKRETKLGNPTLRAEVEKTHDPDLELTLRGQRRSTRPSTRWSTASRRFPLSARAWSAWPPWPT